MLLALVIIVAYVAVWVVYGWRLSLRFLDLSIRNNLRKYPNTYYGAEGVAKSIAEDRPGSLVAGFGTAAFWPLSMPARAAYRPITDKGLMRTAVEQEFAERAELEQLRRQARELGLPMPDSEREA